MSKFSELFESDMHRYGGSMRFFDWRKRYHYYFRKVTTCKNRLLNFYYRFMYRRICDKHGIEIPRSTIIGGGLYIGHPYNITINASVVIGKNVNIHKGVTIGQENRGKREGVPSIGNYVWIGINSTIVGRISIGDDVLIAPNSYVNKDVPPHSIVIGNPWTIIHSERATKDYINNCISIE